MRFDRREFGWLIQGLPQNSRTIRAALMDRHGIQVKGRMNRQDIAREILSKAPSSPGPIWILVDLMLSSQSTSLCEGLRRIATEPGKRPSKSDPPLLKKMWEGSLRDAILEQLKNHDAIISVNGSGDLKAPKSTEGAVPRFPKADAESVATGAGFIPEPASVQRAPRVPLLQDAKDSCPGEWKSRFNLRSFTRWFSACNLFLEEIRALSRALGLDDSTLRKPHQAPAHFYGRVPFDRFKKEYLATLREAARVDPVDTRTYLRAFLATNGSLLQLDLIERTDVPDGFKNSIRSFVSQMKRNFDVGSHRRQEINEDQVKNSFVCELLRILGWPTHDIRRVTAEAPIRTRGEADFLVQHATYPIVIEAKRPSKALEKAAWKQTLAYATHRSINARWFMLVNGVQLRVFNSEIPYHATPVFTIDFDDTQWILSDTDIRHLFLLSRSSLDNTQLDRCFHESVSNFFEC